MVCLTAAATLSARATTYTFTTVPPFNWYAVNGNSLATVQIFGGTTYTLTVNVNASYPLFLTADASANSGSQNYYAVNPGAFSSSAMSAPVTSATVNFTPAISNATYYLHYVNANGGTPSGTIEIDPPIVAPDTTSTILISRPIVPTNGPATVTVVPRVNGNIVNSSSAYFSMSVSANGGSVSSLSPSTGTNFTASYTAGITNGLFTVFDGFGASVPVSVIKSFPLSSFTLTNLSGTQRLLTARSFSNCTYQVLASTNFTTWINLGSATTSTNGVLQFIDNNTPFPPRRFYRFTYP